MRDLSPMFLGMVLGGLVLATLLFLSTPPEMPNHSQEPRWFWFGIPAALLVLLVPLYAGLHRESHFWGAMWRDHRNWYEAYFSLAAGVIGFWCVPLQAFPSMRVRVPEGVFWAGVTVPFLIYEAALLGRPWASSLWPPVRENLRSAWSVTVRGTSKAYVAVAVVSLALYYRIGADAVLAVGLLWVLLWRYLGVRHEGARERVGPDPGRGASAQPPVDLHLPLTTAGRIKRWFRNPVLVEWDEPVAWSDFAAQRGHEALRRLARVLALRMVPMGAALFALGFWLIGRIPGGLPPPPYSIQALAAGFLLAPLLLPYAALPFLRPWPGTRRRIRLHLRGLQGATENHVWIRSWSAFDAFDFGSFQGVELLKLRLRGTWLSRGLRPKVIVALGMNPSEVSRTAARDVLMGRGLHEEPLGEPT